MNCMKKLHILLSGALIFVLLGMNSCEKWIDTDINIDPNEPDDVSLALLLPGAQSGIAYVYGGDHTRFTTLWMQQLAGIDRQMFDMGRYQVREADANNLWNTLYSDVLMNLQIMMDKAEDAGAEHYAGISKVLTAHTLGLITQVWGDAPYSDAFKGQQGQLASQYDSQEVLYATIQRLLDEAIVHFGNSNQVGAPVPTATSDLIYGGQVARWNSAAKSLKLRYALHLSKRNTYTPVKAILDQGGFISSNAADFKFTFGSSGNEWNPRYQFDLERTDIRAGKVIVDMMVATNDPRMPVYFNRGTAANYVGVPAGASGTAASAMIGPGFSAPGAPVDFITFAEVKFIEAEVLFATGNAEGAASAYNAGVKASLAKHGVSNPAWEATYAAETLSTISLQKIIEAKYVANYINSEVYVDYRRVGYPVIPAPINPSISQMPRRFLYPIDERRYNGDNVPKDVTETTRFWWDVAVQ